ncbi:TetR/AcrR family transcriptional regulator [Paenibacillus sp. SC116]|uniref:TetR/AcrR family transcriptional regulator n=1 Tax=Paenibacillus sp. SC116 TaxID=2968986 RepID=UPI00215ADA91|nr:TetR/AcrR family transcriptional regulator [Paenibacillus sp. SC116]MCR8846325.1 TetR/AcrR family transcriptional regulator [Paenibacillus sp. SC116]
MNKAQRSELTKQAILSAAAELFTNTGFEEVTMREIAKQAGCSHTAIYIYFQDKETLLFQLARQPLQQLQDRLHELQQDTNLASDATLKQMALALIHFGLTYRSMYHLFFFARSSRVDEKEPNLVIQKLRNDLFSILRASMADMINAPADDPQTLAYTRAFYYCLHGIITTYLESEEPDSELHDRLDDTFELTIDIFLAGIRQHIQR